MAEIKKKQGRPPGKKNKKTKEVIPKKTKEKDDNPFSGEEESPVVVSQEDSIKLLQDQVDKLQELLVKERKTKEALKNNEYKNEQAGMKTFGIKNKVEGSKIYQSCSKCNKRVVSTVNNFCEDCYNVWFAEGGGKVFK